MTQESNQLDPKDENLDKPAIVEEKNADPDGALVDLVELVNRIGTLEMGVTLHVSGTVISGILTSGRNYFETVAKRFREHATQAEIGEAFAEKYERIAAFYKEDEVNKDDLGRQGDPVFNKTTYIHLRDATVHTTGDSVPLPPTLWRGRLSHVSGWSIGNFGGSN
jgi:hypothetical protein